jgi:hypothetical protein
MLFRIGVNVGDVMFKEGDIFGDGVNVAARLEGLVRGGEICVSRGVHDHLRHRGMAFDDLGEQLVKNIAHPIRAFRLRIGGDQSEQEAPTSGELAGSPDAPSASPAISELSADNEVALELALWDSVKDGSPAELESYLERYPEGTFARSPEHGLMPPRFRPQAHRRRRPRKSPRSISTWPSGTPSRTAIDVRSFRPIWNSIRTASSPGAPGRASHPQM